MEKYRIVLYGLTAENLQQVDLSNEYEQVVGVVTDLASGSIELSLDGQVLYTGNVLCDDDIPALDFDYVVFMQHDRGCIACKGLLDRGILQEQIVPYHFYKRYVSGQIYHSLSFDCNVLNILATYHVHNCLDAHGFVQGMQLYGQQEIKKLAQGINFDLLSGAGQDANKHLCGNLYRRVLQGEDEAANYDYDGVLLTDYADLNEMAAYIAKYLEQVGKIFVSVVQDDSVLAQLDLILQKLNLVYQMAYYDVLHRRLFVIHKELPEQAKIFVVTHKPFALPADSDSCYQVIHAGRALGEDLGYLGDDTGDQISRLNPVLNELTAMYWMYKNADYAYVGMVHYRRYFAGVANACLQESDMREVLSDYDMAVLAPPCFYDTNEELILHDVGETAYMLGKELILKSLSKYQPDYVECFLQVIEGVSLYPCNMFLARKNVFRAYCRWLFSFILEPAESFLKQQPTSDWRLQSRRTIGYFAERMLSVWLAKQDLKVKFLQLVE